jgi:hypothetical protein
MDLVVYTGKLNAYNLHRPVYTTFPKGLPCPIHSAHRDRLPAGDFEDFDPAVHLNNKVPNESLKPILFRFPVNASDIVPCLAVLNKFQGCYPYSPFLCIIQPPYDCLLEGFPRITVAASYNVQPHLYLLEIPCKIPKQNPLSYAHTQTQFSKEFCYLQYYRMSTGHDKAKPTLMPLPKNQGAITILNGSDKEYYWHDLGEYLSKQNYDQQLLYSDNPKDFVKRKQYVDQSAMVIALGEDPLSIYAAYRGIPVFTFLFESESVHSYQLEMFNNAKSNLTLHTMQNRAVEFKTIYKTLRETVIPKMLSGEQVERSSKARQVVKVPNESQRTRSKVKATRTSSDVQDSPS